MPSRPIVSTSFRVASRHVSVHAYRDACEGATQQADVRSVVIRRMKTFFFLFCSLFSRRFSILAPPPPTYDSKVLRNSYAEYYQVWKSFRYSRKLLVFTRNARRCKTSLEKRWENLGVSFLKSRFKFSRCVV